MATIEVHGLATRCRLRLVGSRADELTDAVAAAWSRCLDARGPEQRGADLVVGLLAVGERPGERCDVEGTDLARVMQAITQSVTRVNVAAQTGRLFMLHAGAVADPVTGRALVYAAKGGTGKTTLSRRLGVHLGYLTDETVGFTADGLIHPYPKPLSIRPADSFGPKQEVSPDDLGLAPTVDGARFHQLVLLDRRTTREDPPSFTRLDTISALADLAPESSALSSMPRPLRSLAALLERGRPAVRLTYREASQAVDGLRALLEA